MDQEFTFYTWKSCSTCRNAKKSLNNLGIHVLERDFFADRFSLSELSDLVVRVPAHELFSWRSPSAKPYRDRRDSISSEELLKLMLDEPRLIRRPILLPHSGPAVVGHDKDKYSALAP